MTFTRVDDISRKAPKLLGEGELHYSLWVDDQGNECVCIDDNVGGGPHNGSFPDDLFRLDDIDYRKEFTAYNVTNGTKRTASDKNLSGFLRAIKNHLGKERKSAGKD